MSDLQRTREAFEKALEARGWYREGETIFAPHRTVWFSELDSWLKNIAEFHLRMKERRDRITSNTQHHQMDPQQHKNAVEDADGLISAIEEMTAVNQDKS
jgi:hypothetical protein